jgi:hypothetical protein
MAIPLPAPVYAQNAPVEALQTAEHFVLCTTRLWVARYVDPSGGVDLPNLAEGFVAARAAEGQAPFEAFFHILAVGARRSLDIRCMKCPCLGEDEARLLQAVSLLQHQRPVAASAILAQWLEPAPARLSLEPLARFAYALADAGLTVARRHMEAAFAGQHVSCPDRGLALVQ